MSAFNSAWHIFVFMTGSGDASRRCVPSLDRAIFSDSSSRWRPANFIRSEWRIRVHLRDYSWCVIMNWGKVQNLKRWIPRARNYAVCLPRLMSLFMYEIICSSPTARSSLLHTLIPQLSSFYLSVRVKWKSEVLHFSCFAPFKRKGKTICCTWQVCWWLEPQSVF